MNLYSYVISYGFRVWFYTINVFILTIGFNRLSHAFIILAAPRPPPSPLTPLLHYRASPPPAHQSPSHLTHQCISNLQLRPEPILAAARRLVSNSSARPPSFASAQPTNLPACIRRHASAPAHPPNEHTSASGFSVSASACKQYSEQVYRLSLSNTLLWVTSARGLAL